MYARHHKLVLLAVASLSLSLAPRDAEACSCAPLTVAQSFENSDMVFTARAVDFDGGDGFELEVLRVFKGLSPQERRLTLQPPQSTCDYRFEADQTYLVFASGHPERPSVSICTHTRRRASAGPLLDWLEMSADVRAIDTEVIDVGTWEGTPDATGQVVATRSLGSGPQTWVDSLAMMPSVATVSRSRASRELSIRGLQDDRVAYRLGGVELNSQLLGFDSTPHLTLTDPFSLSAVEVDRGVRVSQDGAQALGGVVGLRRFQPTLGEPGVRAQGTAQFGVAELEKTGAVRVEGLTSGGITLFGGGYASWRDDLSLGGQLADEAGSGYDHFAGDFGFTMDWVGIYYAGAVQRDIGATEGDDFGSFRLSGRDRHIVEMVASAPTDLPGLDLISLRFDTVVFGQRFSDQSGNAGDDFTLNNSGGLSITSSLSSFSQLRSDVSFRSEQILGDDTLGQANDEGVNDGSATRFEVGSRFSSEVGPDWQIEAGGRLIVQSQQLPRESVAEVGPISTRSLGGGWHLGASWDISELFIVGAQVRGGTRQPNIREMAAVVRTTDSTLLGNPDLSVEQVAGAELSLGLRDEAASLSLFGYYDRFFGLVQARPTGQVDPGNLDEFGVPLPFVSYRNQGQAHNYGVEVVGSVVLGDVLLFASAAWMANAVTSNQPFPTASPFAGNFGVRYEHPIFGALIRSRFAVPADASLTQRSTTGWATLGLSAWVTPNDWLRFVASVDNSADAGYRTHGSTIAEPGFNGVLTIQIDYPGR